jgi:N-formylglutamate deformylase
VTGSAFDVLSPRRPRLPVVAHIPHASTVIPPEHRARLLLEDAALGVELIRLTDWHTDELFGWLPGDGVAVLLNRISRLVVDPVRFLDDRREAMAAVGQGVVYSRTTDGAPLREVDPTLREEYVARYYLPYHRALSGMVASVLEEHGSCLILDCHSFPSRPLPSERDQDPDRPDICIGTDAIHTPPALAARLERAFAAEGFRIRRDSPFSGALVPLEHYGRGERVASVMIEVRRDLYCDEATGRLLPVFSSLRASLAHALRSVLPGAAT